MPVHNGGPYLAAAIESILGQTFADFELLIIDDGSSDLSYEIARGYGDSRIRLVRNAQNLGLIATLNRGLQEARGEYVARMDADDVSLPERLEAQAGFLDRHAAVGMLGTAVQVIDADGTPGGVARFPLSHDLIRWTLCFQSPIAHPAAMMRKALVLELGGYRSHALHCEDYDLWWRASEVARLANLDRVLLRLRKHAENITVRHASVHDAVAVDVCRANLERILGEELPRELVAALMGRGHRSEALVARAVEVLFRYARACRSGQVLHKDLVDRVSVWLDAAQPPEGGATGLARVKRNVRAAGAAALAPDEQVLVRRAAARRAALRVLRRAALRVVRRLTTLPAGTREHFTRIYRRNTFGSRESRSGQGSTAEQTATIRREVPALLRELGAKSVLDAPCGDLNWLRQTELGVERYTGVDIVRELVDSNRARFGGNGREFLCGDLSSDPLPAADVILCRDCLVHLSFRDAEKTLANFKRSGSRYLLTTTFPARETNVELSAGMIWRTLNLERAPFNLPPPLRLINENCSEAGGAFADKSLGLWRLEDLPSA
jgi:hypothetical protein